MLARKASDAAMNNTENPIPGEMRSTPSMMGPNKPAAAADPAVLKFASPKKRADSFFGNQVGEQSPAASGKGGRTK